MNSRLGEKKSPFCLFLDFVKARFCVHQRHKCRNCHSLFFGQPPFPIFVDADPKVALFSKWILETGFPIPRHEFMTLWSGLKSRILVWFFPMKLKLRLATTQKVLTSWLRRQGSFALIFHLTLYPFLLCDCLFILFSHFMCQVGVPFSQKNTPLVFAGTEVVWPGYYLVIIAPAIILKSFLRQRPFLPALVPFLQEKSHITFHFISKRTQGPNWTHSLKHQSDSQALAGRFCCWMSMCDIFSEAPVIPENQSKALWHRNKTDIWGVRVDSCKGQNEFSNACVHAWSESSVAAWLCCTATREGEDFLLCMLPSGVACFRVEHFLAPFCRICKCRRQIHDVDAVLCLSTPLNRDLSQLQLGKSCAEMNCLQFSSQVSKQWQVSG